MAEEVKPFPFGPMGIPSDRIWFDPALINAATQIQQSTVVLPMNTTVPLVALNTKRWAVGFFPPTVLGNLYIAPWQDVTTYPYATGATQVISLWFNLFTYGPLVSSQWFGNCSSASSIRVIELIRQ